MDKRAITVIVLVLAVLGVLAAQTRTPAPQAGGYQRFIPMPRQPENLTGLPWSGAFSLDSKTGILCRTYDGPAGGFEKLDSCLDLYHRY